ncbi:hypothetical protein IAQ61_009535 [Plenodomus lingam]|uniref:uncharacterized protein n=1 Tax=Leptosphaeria maculans TaxID=5022 RepID=UPI00332E23D3|nr:hypothetical protein IAQ61_009535 [Plenodomus lingam]
MNNGTVFFFFATLFPTFAALSLFISLLTYYQFQRALSQNNQRIHNLETRLTVVMTLTDNIDASQRRTSGNADTTGNDTQPILLPATDGGAHGYRLPRFRAQTRMRPRAPALLSEITPQRDSTPAALPCNTAVHPVATVNRIHTNGSHIDSESVHSSMSDTTIHGTKPNDPSAYASTPHNSE